MNRRLATAFGLSLCFALALAAGCRLYDLERRLDSENADFLSKVRYLITASERKSFLELPDSAKPGFIEDFWKRRDPDPETEVNEFKTEYVNRLERANRMFVGEAKPGWLTDRGRIFILFGPPTDRVTQPMGSFAEEQGREIWTYGDFPVLFTDRHGTGVYKLETYDLSGIRELDLTYMHELNRSLAGAREVPPAPSRARPMDFEMRFDVAVHGPERFEAAVKVDVPFDRIWFSSLGGGLTTTIKATLEIQDARKSVAWHFEAKYELSIEASALKEKTGQSYSFVVPVVIADAEKIAGLSRGENQLRLTLENSTGGETSTKTLTFARHTLQAI